MTALPWSVTSSCSLRRGRFVLLLEVGFHSPWLVPHSFKSLRSSAARPLVAVGLGPLVGVVKKKKARRFS